MSHRRSPFVALALSIVPGWGHVYFGREVLGLAIFTLFAVALFVLLNGLYLYLGPWRTSLTVFAVALLSLVTLGCWIDIIRRTGRRQVRAEEEARQLNLRNGMVAYLRSDLDQAVGFFRACLRANPLDVEALFRLGVVLARSGDGRLARSCLRRVLKHDTERKWHWEVARELEKLSHASKIPWRASGMVSIQDEKSEPSSPKVGS